MKSDSIRKAFLSFCVFFLCIAALAPQCGGTVETGKAFRRMVRLPGHVLPALSKATAVQEEVPTEAPMILTLVLNRTDQAGFNRYLRNVYDPKSASYRRFLTPLQLSDRFGPSVQKYEAILHYLKQNGFELVEGSTNRLTITVKGGRASTESAFNVKIVDYEIGDRSFFANDNNPGLPIRLASHIQAVIGLTNLPQPVSSDQAIKNLIIQWKCQWKAQTACSQAQTDEITKGTEAQAKACKDAYDRTYRECLTQEKNNKNYTGPIPGESSGSVAQFVDNTNEEMSATAGPGTFLVDGSGQTIGLLQFDTFQVSDVSNYLNLFGLPLDLLNNLSEVKVNGGAPLGANESEVLLDIAAVMTVAPGAQIVVYDAPFTGAGTSFQTLLNAMINGGVDIISNSWAYCEDQTTLADVQSIDTIFQTAAASGISVFNATGDSGSTCLNGAANTIVVPAGSPNATAVGGSSLTSGPGNTYVSEIWWNGSLDIPPSGQGGFGTSKFFTRPTYQNGLNLSANRSIPDVVSNADPAQGDLLCQASAGGCPTGALFGGTSVAAPTWAAFAALLNEANGANLGFLNPLLYNLVGTSAFHPANSLGTDFVHVGLGSPNVNQIYLLLSGSTAGLPDPSVSLVETDFGIPPNPAFPALFADGVSEGFVIVRLRDSLGNAVSGKTVSLAANPSGNVVITTTNPVSTMDNGAVVFKVTNLMAEEVTFTATDVTDGIVLSETPKLFFLVPPAASAGIGASPTTVPANGSSFSTITVTLQDSLNRPTPGKQVLLSQGSSHSIIGSLNPGTTDANGQVQFIATNLVTENVTYTATDVTDANLSVPGSAVVSFINGSAFSCGGTLTPVAGAQFKYTDFISGLPSLAFNGGCNGFGMVFDSSGNLFVSAYGGLSLPSRLYKFGPSGGTAAASNLLVSYASGTCASAISYSKDGQHVYMARQFCGSGGDVVEVSTTDGSIIRTVASGINCATGLGTDPISGDLFVSQPCPSGSANITRISNPQSVTPTVSVYSSPGFSLGVNFTPDGTLWTESFDFGLNTRFFTKISATNSPTPGAFTRFATDTVVDSNNATSLLPLLNAAAPGQPSLILVNSGAGVISKLDLAANPITQTAVFTGGTFGTFIISGPDGCAYASQSDRIVRITATDGSCNFAASSPLPSLSLSPGNVTPNPFQGTTKTFTATLSNQTSPAGTPITFQVKGANPQSIMMVPANTNGQASYSYSALFTGTDTIVAFATVADKVLSSNTARVTWDPGKHGTFLSLNPSPNGSTVNQPTTVIASLSDVSLLPPVALANQSINFALGSSQCSDMTDAGGIASCQITPGQVGIGTLTANFAGTTEFVGSSDSIGFTVLASIANQSPDAVNDSASTTPNTPVTINVLSNDSDPDGDSLTITSVTQGANGTVVKNNGTVTYTPNNSFTGTDSFNYTISDGRGGTDTATVTVTVANVICLKDDSNGNSLKLNLVTGQYFFRTSTGVIYSNFAVITKVNNVVSFRSVNTDTNLLQGTIQQGTATAWLQVPRKSKKVFKLNDSNITNNGVCP